MTDPTTTHRSVRPRSPDAPIASRDRAERRIAGLRANSLAATVMLLVEYVLGIWVNLYGHLPAIDRGANLAAGFARAFFGGPVGLALHAALGVLLLASATAALVRAARLRRGLYVGVALVGLLAVLTAGVSGAHFVGSADAGSSFAMAIAAGIAIGCYALLLFVVAPPYQDSRDGLSVEPADHAVGDGEAAAARNS